MLEVDAVVRRFGGVVALDGLSFTVERGRMVGFVGANGAGKTTTMRIIMGVDRPDAGEVRFDGRRSGLGAAQRFGYIPEERGLYPRMSAAAQVAYLGRLRGMDRSLATERAATWLGRVGLGDRAADPVEQLSLGNQQRVQLAAALVHDPALLVLDEPFSGLDPVGVDLLAGVLRERVEAGVGVLFSSHQLETVEELCDEVVIIDHGRLVAAGGVDDLRRRGRPPTYRVVVEGAGSGWARSLTGVGIVTEDGAASVIELHELDSDDLLDAARGAGRVTAFAPVVPRLHELYREVVAAGAEAATARAEESAA